MHYKGHFGLTLAIFSFLMIPFGFNGITIAIIGIAVGISSIPDIDLDLEIKHRGLTHNLFFALLVGFLFGFLFLQSNNITHGVLGFVGGFGGVVCHLIGDIFTYQKFKPLWPFSRKEIGFGWFESGSKLGNDGFMGLGILAFILYALIASGELATLIR